MAKVLVVYCTMTGNTKAAAEAVADGARSAGATVTLKRGRDATAEDLQGADAVALGSYDAFSYMGGELKEFFDRTFYPVQKSVAGKPYVAFLTHGGSGKAISSLESVAQAFKFKKAADSASVKGLPDAKATASLKALGTALAGAAGK
jgi:flavodoxin